MVGGGRGAREREGEFRHQSQTDSHEMRGRVALRTVLVLRRLDVMGMNPQYCKYVQYYKYVLEFQKYMLEFFLWVGLLYWSD